MATMNRTRPTSAIQKQHGERRKRAKTLFAAFRKHLVEDMISTNDLQMVIVNGFLRDINNHQWRSLIFNMRRNHSLLVMPADQLIDTLIRDPCQLATEEVKRERQRVIEDYQRQRMPNNDCFSVCDACGEKKLMIQYARRPTGQGRKCEDVCIKQCHNCSFKQQ